MSRSLVQVPALRARAGTESITLSPGVSVSGWNTTAKNLRYAKSDGLDLRGAACENNWLDMPTSPARVSTEPGRAEPTWSRPTPLARQWSTASTTWPVCARLRGSSPPPRSARVCAARSCVTARSTLSSSTPARPRCSTARAQACTSDLRTALRSSRPCRAGPGSGNRRITPRRNMLRSSCSTTASITSSIAGLTEQSSSCDRLILFTGDGRLSRHEPGVRPFQPGVTLCGGPAGRLPPREPKT